MEKFGWFSWTRVDPLLLDGPRLGGKEPQLRLTRRKHLPCGNGLKLRPGNCSWQANRRHHSRIQAGPVEANRPGAGKTHRQGTIALWSPVGSPCGWLEFDWGKHHCTTTPPHARGCHAERVERISEAFQNQEEKPLPPTTSLRDLLLRNLNSLLDANIKCLQCIAQLPHGRQ